ncbi:MAG: efflux transporter outer membrane subunit [Burkholderiaceae bacterium]
MTRLTLMACALALAGCALGPDYRRPDLGVPAVYRSADLGGAVAALDSQWWKQFGDPALDALVVEAVANNRNLQVAVANVERAAGALTQTRSALFPQLNYSAQGEKARASERGASPLPSVIPNPSTSYQAVAAASWELDLWGKIRRQTEAAQASLLATEEARRGVVLSLVSSVVSTYIQLLSLDEQLEIARRTTQTYDESLKLFELQFKYGVVSQINVAQARSQYEGAQASIPQLRLQITQTENALSILLGRNPAPVARSKTLSQLSRPTVPGDLPSQLLTRRPDVLAAEQQLVAANAQIGAARALYFPSISLTGALGGASADLSDLFKGPARVWNYAGSITGPIFNAGAISGQVQQAEAGQKAALASYESAVQSAFADVDNSLAARLRVGEQMAAQGRLVDALRDYSRLARLQYGAGYAPYYAVLQAEQSLFPQELSYAGTRASSLIAVVNLYKAMGGGWIEQAAALSLSSKQP